MISVIKKTLTKYYEQISYLIVGVITTFVSWGVFHLFTYLLDSQKPLQLFFNEILNWAAGVFVAYPLNRKFVFKSDNNDLKKEIFSFIFSRVVTFVLSYILMWLFVNVLEVNEYISKYIIVSSIIVITNYIFSKIFVFKISRKRC